MEPVSRLLSWMLSGILCLSGLSEQAAVQQPQSMEEKVLDSEKPNTLEKVEVVSELYGGSGNKRRWSYYSQIQATVLWQLLLGGA